jgi:hypothetical protein
VSDNKTKKKTKDKHPRTHLKLILHMIGNEAEDDDSKKREEEEKKKKFQLISFSSWLSALFAPLAIVSCEGLSSAQGMSVFYIPLTCVVPGGIR